MSWTPACKVDEIESGEAIALETDPPVAVFRVDDEFLATADTCSHDQSSLADGWVDDDVVECSWHFAKFCLRTGEALTLPATEGVSTFITKIEDGVVYVDI